VRLFIALKTDLNKDKIFSYEKNLMRTFPDVKWVEKENLHLTLKFLGETSEETKNEVIAKLSGIAKKSSPFRFYYSGIGAFPALTRARVIFIGVSKGDTIVSLMKTIDASFANLGFKREKSYIPHLTLGRVKNGTVNLKHFHIPVFETTEVRARGITLIKSTLTRKGPIYEDISEFDFA